MGGGASKGKNKDVLVASSASSEVAALADEDEEDADPPQAGAAAPAQSPRDAVPAAAQPRKPPGLPASPGAGGRSKGEGSGGGGGSGPSRSPAGAGAPAASAFTSPGPKRPPLPVALQAKQLAAEEEGSNAGPDTPTGPGTPRGATSEVEMPATGRSQAATPEALIAACREGDLEALEACIAAGLTQKGDESLVDAHGNSVLHYAVHSGSTAVLEELLGPGKVRVDMPNAQNETALQFACRKGNESMAALLLKRGAEPDRTDARGLTPFLSAVFASGYEALPLLDMLVAAKSSCIDARDARGVAALHFGALHGDARLLSWLLQQLADPNAQTDHGTTPLMLAAKRGCVDCAKVLLHEGSASTGLADDAGCTALMQALGAGSDEVAACILNAGASVDVVDGAGRSALFHAVLGGSGEAVAHVLQCGGRVNVLDEDGRSPLYQACLMDQRSLVDSLLQAQADPNLAGRGTLVCSRNPEGPEDQQDDGEAARLCLNEARTCLQVCAFLAHNELLARLLEAGADPNAAPGSLGWTALHLCGVVGNEEAAGMLLAKGAVPVVEDVEGNTAASLAERAGHEAMLARLHAAVEEAAAAAPGDGQAAGGSQTPKRSQPPKLGALPPLRAGADEEGPPEDVEPLSLLSWEERNSNGSLLDNVFGPKVHDAFQSEQWRDRWEALLYVAKHFGETSGDAAQLVAAVCSAIATASKDKVPKVFAASLAVLEELLSDSRVDELSSEAFTAQLQGKSGEDGTDIVTLLIEQTDVGGGSSVASSPQQAAAEALCSLVLHGRVALDELAFPLMCRLEHRLVQEATTSKKDRKEAALGPKCLAANLKLLGRWLSAFGLQQRGLFRRALLVPVLLRGAASEHSKARGAAAEALVHLIALSGGLEESAWALLPAKAQKAIQKHAQGQEGIALLSAAPCQEDAMPKSIIVEEDGRTEPFVCVSELNTEVWSLLLSGEYEKVRASRAPATRSGKAQEGSEGYGVANDQAATALQEALSSKSWQARADSIGKLASELAVTGDGVKLVEDAADGSGRGPLLSQYVLRGHRISGLQAALDTIVRDSVTAVFTAGADLLRLVCGHVPLYIAPLFLEPLLLPFVGRLLDSSNKVRSKVVETTLEIAVLHGSALNEMIAQCVASGSAWNSPSGLGGSSTDAAGRETDRSVGPRLQLLVQLLLKGGFVDKWTDDTFNTLADYAVSAAQHRSGDVRKEAVNLLNTLNNVGDRASVVAEGAMAHLQAIAQQKACKRPGTSIRPMTSSTRLSSAGGTRPGTGTGSQFGASGHLSNLGSTSNTLNLGSTGRLSTASRTKTASSFRLSTATRRPLTGALARDREMDEESDNSVPEEPQAPEVPPADVDGREEDGVKFYDVQTACPGADEIPDLAEGEAVLREVLPLAEPIDEVARDFVAPLVALFGDGWTRCFYSRHWQCRVAALTHLAASIPRRLEETVGPEMSPGFLGEILDGSMRAVHEGLGDQNVRVYAEACLCVNAVVPAFCGVVDGRLLVAHLAPLLRQLCARMGDSKEAVRTQTTMTLFRLLQPPVGKIVSPLAMAMLILRNLVPPKEMNADGEAEASSSAAKGTAVKGAATAWLCRIGALRDLCKEHSRGMVLEPGAHHPGEWLRLKDGLIHSDPTVRHESARLYVLVCKMHLKPLGDEEVQRPGREAWVAALPKEMPAKSLTQVRKLLKLPEQESSSSSADVPLNQSLRGAGPAALASAAATIWDVPINLSAWAGCSRETLSVLRAPAKGDEKAVMSAMRALGRAACGHESTKSKSGVPADEAFAGVCKALQQVLGSAVGADRAVFLAAIDLCQTVITKMSSTLSGLDLNMGLAKTFPVLMERTSLSGASDVKVGVASDKLVQQLASHPKIGCEAVTKMVVMVISRTERPIRAVVLLRTLLGDYGLRLCAQRDIITLLLGAIGTQLERLAGENGSSSEAAADGMESLRPQLVAVLAICDQFSSETVRYCMSEVDPPHRKLLIAALKEAPDPRLVALGATAAEQDAAEVVHVAGSAIRAASRRRDSSPKPSGAPQRSVSPSNHRPPVATVASSDGRHARLSEDGLPHAGDMSPVRRRQRVALDEEPLSPLSPQVEASMRGTWDSRPSPLHGGMEASMRGTRRAGDAAARPPRPGAAAPPSMPDGGRRRPDLADPTGERQLQRVGSSERPLVTGKARRGGDGLGALVDALSQTQGAKAR